MDDAHAVLRYRAERLDMREDAPELGDAPEDRGELGRRLVAAEHLLEELERALALRVLDHVVGLALLAGEAALLARERERVGEAAELVHEPLRERVAAGPHAAAGDRLDVGRRLPAPRRDLADELLVGRPHQAAERLLARVVEPLRREQ